MFGFDTLTVSGSAQQRKGEYSPFKSPSTWRSMPRIAALNKGRGNIPPSSTVQVAPEGETWYAQQRKGEYSPFKGGKVDQGRRR